MTTNQLAATTVIEFPAARRAADIEAQRCAEHITKVAKRLNRYNAERAKFFLQCEGKKLFLKLRQQGVSEDTAHETADAFEQTVWSRLLQLRRQGYGC